MSKKLSNQRSETSMPAKGMQANANPPRKHRRSAFRRLVHKLRGFVATQLRHFSRLIFFPVQQFGRTAAFSAAAIARWQRTRNFRQLAAALPAVIVSVACLGFFTYQYFRDADIKSRLANKYMRAAFEAIDREQPKTAITYIDRLISLRGDDKEAIYGLAVALDKARDAVRLPAVAETIAPMGKAVYAPAHIWRAKRILESDGGLTPEMARAAEIQLLYAIELKPTDAMAHLLLGRLYLLAGRFEGAVEHLQLAVEQYPEDLLELAKAHIALDQREEAIRVGERAVAYLGEQLTKDSLNLGIRLKLAESVMFFEKFELAIQLLEQGLAVQDAPELHRAMARVHLTHARVLRHRGEIKELLVHLQAAIQADPNEVQAFEHVMYFLDKKDSEAEKLRTFLKKTLTEGQATALIHLILGCDAGARGETSEGIRHLDLALKSEPKMALAANNLAWMLAHSDPPQLDRALTLAEAATGQNPRDPAFHHTRGVILIKMGRWQDGAVELEKILSTKGTPDTREILAKAYDELGLKELADQQRRLAAELRLEEEAKKKQSTPLSS